MKRNHETILFFFQGIFLVILYCFLNSEVQEAMKREFNRLLTNHNIQRNADGNVELKFLTNAAKRYQVAANGNAPKTSTNGRNQNHLVVQRGNDEENQLFRRTESPPEILILRNPLAEEQHRVSPSVSAGAEDYIDSQNSSKEKFVKENGVKFDMSENGSNMDSNTAVVVQCYVHTRTNETET